MATNYAHFITFPVASTNIFPLVNSTQGGQLVTEFNLKSREMVATNPAIKYAQGPSFIHSLDDFKVKLYEDPESGNSASTSILQVDPGRAVINGHYVESLAPMTIDLNVANAELQQNSQAPLYGNLSIGIKSYFSTESTMAGSMLVENTDKMYVGVQLVIALTSEFKTPDDCPEEADRSNVVADLKLADFTYVNGVISPSSILINSNATRFIPSERIFDFDSILDDKYVTTVGLEEKKFYTMSGKSKDWCESTGSLMIWDADPYHRETTVRPTLQEAQFSRNTVGGVSLVIPHKQHDGEILNDNNDRVYFADKELTVPTANYDSELSGVVDSTFIKHIKIVENALNTYKQFTNGKQIKYIDVLNDNNKTTIFAEIDPNAFNIGDYVLVREDYTVFKSSSSEGTAPSTMYVILPGGVNSISWNNKTKPSGLKLGTTSGLWEGEDDGHSGPPTPSYPDADDLLARFNYTTFIGTLNDYFELVYYNIDDTVGTSYYYKVASTGPNTWSESILLTGGIPLATETQRGGFYNVSSEVTDAGYVTLDSTGHLRLIDYELLRSGTLAYQLGSDYVVPSNSTLAYVQNYLDDRVNTRVAFPFAAELTSVPSMINVTLTLPSVGDDDNYGVINIYNIDSRFDTGVYLHFLFDDASKDYSKLVINISNCEKIRIDSSITTLPIGNGPIINVFKSGLYYDPIIINYIRTCDLNNIRATLFPAYTDFTGFDNLKLWYARFKNTDPDIEINGMEVLQPTVNIIPEEIAFWDENIVGDNHYEYALRSITLGGNSDIIACSLYVSNDSTQTVNTTQHIIIGGDFILPQGSELNYPVSCVTAPLQITGTFTTAYLDGTQTKWITTETSFTARSGIYDISSGMGNGSIAFNSKTELIDTTYTNVDSLDGWEPGAFHIFYGGTTVGYVNS